MAQPFNEVEMMVLSKIAYYNPPKGNYRSDGTATDPCSLYDMVIDNKINRELLKEFEPEVVQSFMNKVRQGNYTVVKAVDQKYGSGFEAIAVVGPDSSTVTVAARGSESKTMYDTVQDWGVADFVGLGTMSESKQQEDMDAFLSDLDGYDNVYLTGHSLGGNLAVSGAVGYKDQSKIKGVYTYNSPGQNSAYIAKNIGRIRKIADKVTNFVTEDDYVSDVNTPIGKTVVVKSNRKKDDHYLSNFTVSGSGFVTSPNGKKPYHTAVSGIIDGITAVLSVNVLISPLLHLMSHQFKNTDLPLVYDKLSEWSKKLYEFLRLSEGNGSIDLIKNIKNYYNNAVSGDVIYIQPDGVMQQAEKIRAFQQEYEAITQKMSNLIIKLREDNVWDAPATTTFINSYLEVKKTFEKFSNTMLRYSEILDGVAQRMQNTDNTLSAKFNNLSI